MHRDMGKILQEVKELGDSRAHNTEPRAYELEAPLRNLQFQETNKNIHTRPHPPLSPIPPPASAYTTWWGPNFRNVVNL